MHRETPKRENDLPKATGLAGGRAKIQTQILYHYQNGIAKGGVQENFLFNFYLFFKCFLT